MSLFAAGREEAGTAEIDTAKTDTGRDARRDARRQIAELAKAKVDSERARKAIDDALQRLAPEC